MVPNLVSRGVTGGAQFTARLDPNARVTKGETRQFVFDARILRLFDRATGMTLATGSPKRGSP